jgi:cytochrome P450/NADPH-cytochrome P450 reductase
MERNSTFSLIVVLKGSNCIEEDGRIIRFGSNANTNAIRTMAAEKLDLLVPEDDIVLETATGVLLTEVEMVRLQQVVYVRLNQEIIEVIPGPRGLPVVGNLYEMMPDM